MYTKETQEWFKDGDFIFLDILCLHLAFVLAYITRHGISNPYVNEIYFNLAVVYTLVDLLVIIVNKSMDRVLKRGYYIEMAQTVKHTFLVAVLVSLYMFSMQSGDVYSRITFYLQAVYYALIAYLVRIGWKLVRRKMNKDTSSIAVFFITNEERSEHIITKFRKNDTRNCLIQGMCIVDADYEGREIDEVPVVVSKDNILRYLRDKWVDEVFVSLPADTPNIDKMVSAIADLGVVVHLELEQLEMNQWQHQVIEEIAGTTVRTVSMTMATPLQRLMKRTLDIIGGIVGCVITLFLTIVLAPMIYIKSPGPIFFTQTRVGKNGKKFKIYKFRSMYMDAEARKAELMEQNRIKGGLMFKLEYDPRIIGCKKMPDGTVKKGIGNYIRDWSLDEFPQFFNVLKGDLSLCGTRPPTVDEWEKYELHHRARLAIKPGITGLWQVSGRSKITDFEEVVELDKQYIRQWSMGLDLRILLKTIKVVLGKDGSM